MNREGTLHIVWLNRGHSYPAQYSVGFTDYVSSGGAMKTRQIMGDEDLTSLLTRIGLDPRVQHATFENLHAEGSTSILRVVLSDDALVSLGLKEHVRTGKEKVEAAISMLRNQGHTAQPVVREDGTMWVEVDRGVLVAWKEMQDLADGVYSYEALLQIYGTMLPLRFTVFFDPGGPILAYSVAGPYMSATFASKAGAQFPNTAELIKALNRAGLPGEEIASMKNATRVYTLSGAQLLHLNLKVPDVRYGTA
jgi:hypothetical protein